MATPRGGTHVQHVTNQLIRHISDHIAKAHPDTTVTPPMIRSHLQVFINCFVESPSFDSQMKEMLVSKPR